VAEDDQHGIGKTFAVHTPKLAQCRANRKPRSPGCFLLNLGPVSGVLTPD
jgi:hypothetical protein